MIPFSIFARKNWIKICFLFINIKLISSLELILNENAKSSYTVVENSLQDISGDKMKDSVSIFDYFIYDESLEFTVQLTEDIDRIILYRSPETIYFLDIYVNNQLVFDIYDNYKNTSSSYTIYFEKIIPANSSLTIYVQFKGLSLLTLANLFQFDYTELTDTNFVDSEGTDKKISLSAYLIAVFTRAFKVTTKRDSDFGTNVESWKFDLNKNEVNESNLLKIILNIRHFLNIFFEEYAKTPPINPLYQLNSIIDTKNFSNINSTSLKLLRESLNVLNKDEEQHLTSNLLYEWSLMYLNLIKPRLEEPDEWIIEGLALYFKYYGMIKYDPSTKIHRRFIEDHLQPALTADASRTPDHIASIFMNPNLADIPQNVKQTFYFKISSLFRMLHLTIGLPTLRHAVNAFYQLAKTSEVSSNQLWNFLQKEIFFDDRINFELNISRMMTPWINRAGYPLLTVDVQDCSVKLHQSRFLWQNKNHTVDQPMTPIWWIPITWLTKKTLNLNSTVPIYWFNQKEDKITISSKANEDWIIFNAVRTGFYRVNYDINSWRRILDTLNSKSFNDIPVIDRMAIIDDIISLVKTGHIPIDIYLQGLQYTAREIYAGPLKIVLKEFINLHEYHADSKDADDVDEFIFYVLKWAYDSLGYIKKPTDDISFVEFRIDLNFLMDDIKFQKCIRSTQDYWKKILKNTETKEKMKINIYKYCSSYNEKLEIFKLESLDELSSLSAVERPLSKLQFFCSQTLYHQNNLDQFQSTANSDDKLNLQVVTKITEMMKSIGNCRNKGIQLVLDYLIQYPALIRYYCKKEPSMLLDLISSFSQKLINPTITFNQLETLMNVSSLECSKIAKSLSIIRENKQFENTFYEKNSHSIVQWIKTKNNESKTYAFINYLLPNDIIPIYYAIKLTPHMIPDNFYFNGEVTITARVIQKTSKIYIHIHKLIYTSISLKADDQDVLINQINYYKQYQYLIIETKENLEVNSLIDIKIQYKGNISQEKRGLYRDFYIDKSNQIKWFAATNLERASARRLFPCFDEPFFKAIFHLSINRAADFRAVSNLKLKSTVIDNDRYIDDFEISSRISTHQIAFVLSEFDSSHQASKSLNWLSQNYAIDLVYPIIQTTHFYSNIEELVNPDQPNDYTYHDELAQLKNQLENYNLIIYEEKNAITNPDYVSLLDKLTYIINWNFEMMHRFFRNYLLMNFWRCEWFNRAISYHFLSVGYENDINSRTEGSSLFIVHNLQPSMLIDASPLSENLVKDDYTAEQINGAYSKFTDDKGTSILRMIEDTSMYLDTTHFFQHFVINIANVKRFSSSYIPTWGDCPQIKLFCQIIETKPPSMDTEDSNRPCLIETWLNQKGFPVVHVTIKNNTAFLSQTPFQYSSFLKTNPEKLWNIPITWTSSVNPDFFATKRLFFLTDRTSSFQLDLVDDFGWVIFNLQQIGYYRVNYDVTMWNRIIETLKGSFFESIHENNRAVIIDDLFNLARGGYVNYTLALSMIEYLIHETNYAPWKAALTNFAFLDKKLAADLDVRQKFRDNVKHLLIHVYEKLDFHEGDDEGFSKSLLRINILESACKYKLPKCLATCKKMFNDWIFDKNNVIPVNLRSIVYCTAIHNGNNTDWTKLFNKYTEESDQSEKSRLIKGLACTDKPDFLYKLLYYSITENPKLEITDSLEIISAVYSSSDEGVETTLLFIDKYYQRIFDYFRDYNIIKDILKGLIAHVTTPELGNNFKDIIQKIGEKFLPIKETILFIYDQIQEEIMWHQNYFLPIAQYFK